MLLMSMLLALLSNEIHGKLTIVQRQVSNSKFCLLNDLHLSQYLLFYNIAFCDGVQILSQISLLDPRQECFCLGVPNRDSYTSNYQVELVIIQFH